MTLRGKSCIATEIDARFARRLRAGATLLVSLVVPLVIPLVVSLVVSLVGPVVVPVVVTLHAQQPAAWKDPSPHRARFVTVSKDVRLEVLDWGGSGSPLVLLAGGGDTAHIFDDFAPKLAASFHVYGITRRGFGASGYSATEYGADRLGDDVLIVLDALKLKRPVLVGHSIAGEELSSIASRHPARVAGLVYLDAGFPYAFDNGQGPAMKDFQDLKPPQPPPPADADFASFTALRQYYLRVLGFTYPEAELRARWHETPDGLVGKRRDSPGFATILSGMKKYTNVPVPALVFVGFPHGQGTWVDNNPDPNVREQVRSYAEALNALTERQTKVIESAAPTARIVKLAGAHHYVYLSNEADVLREMRSFFSRLP